MDLNAIRAKREAQGFNVRFVNERGEVDVASFRSRERADWFRERCAGRGVRVLN